MNIIVCVKQVPDPEAPFANFKIDPAATKVIPPQGVSPVINGFDEQAVEAALRIKDAKNDTKITVISLGNDLVMDVIKKPLSMGADELILLQDPAFESSDSHTTALALAAAIKKVSAFNLVLCGRQASDWDQGQVPLVLAEMLGIPVVTIAKKVEVADSKVKVERVLSDGFEIVEAPLPALVTVSNELGEPRYPTLRGIMAAGRKKPTIWSAKDLGLDPVQIGQNGSRGKMRKVFVPEKRARCELISADSPAEAGAKLALRLREDKII
ncbi:MAG: electron transfer flavoprotein subunit beta/FixA family protein [Chloroflexi bacterium]|nr:electron transfer flavoprotein subunit beta/FixA family protein [Chloroflexota bacterium]